MDCGRQPLGGAYRQKDKAQAWVGDVAGSRLQLCPNQSPGLLILCVLFFLPTLQFSGEDETTPIVNIKATWDGCSREAQIGAKQSQTKGRESFWN